MLAHSNGVQMMFDSPNSLFDIILSITHYNAYSTYLSLLLIIATLDSRVLMAYALFKHSLIVGYLGCLQYLSTINTTMGPPGFSPFHLEVSTHTSFPSLEVAETNACYSITDRPVSRTVIQGLLIRLLVPQQRGRALAG